MIKNLMGMFCGVSLLRKRRIEMIEADMPINSIVNISEGMESVCTDIPWWADVIEPTELANVIRSQCDEKVLLIDCRSFIEFNQCNIVNSINVCCNKIVKRRLQQNKVKIQEFLSSTCHIDIDGDYTVIIYDQSTTDASTLAEDNIVTILGTKCKQVFYRVRVLYGGFLEFQSQHPSLLETKSKTPCQLGGASASLSQPCMPVTNIGPTKILPYLFLGSMKDALSQDVAKANGITYVLNVSMTCPKPSFIQDGHFLRIPVNDNYSEKLLPYFHDAFQFIDKVREGNGCVLVHCLAGISRSPTLAIAYIMRSYNMVSEEAYRYVKEKRATISPNFNFLGQLLEYEQQIAHDTANALTGSKRRCIEDLRAELSSPSSPLLMPRLSCISTVDTPATARLVSPTKTFDKLLFENLPNAACNSNSKGAQSPTSAFSKLRFGCSNDLGVYETLKTSTRLIEEEPEYMTCYTADTIHQQTPVNTSQALTPTRSISLHVLNSNSNNNNNTDVIHSTFEERADDRSTSPNSGLKPSRPMSLSLNTVDQLTSQTSIKRPHSLGVNILEQALLTLPTACNTETLTVSVTETTPPSEAAKVSIEKASVNRQCDFFSKDNSSQTDFMLQDTINHKGRTRPKSMVLSETMPKEQIKMPSTPTTEQVSTQMERSDIHPFAAHFYSSVEKSRSLENMSSLERAQLPTGFQKMPAANTGTRASLHGSLEIIQVS